MGERMTGNLAPAAGAAGPAGPAAMSLAEAADGADWGRGRPPVRDPRVLEFLDGWLRFRGARAMPRRSDIMPMSFPRLLPNLYLYERYDGAGNFRCVLAGEEIHTVWRRPIMGLDVREMFAPADLRRILTRWNRVLDGPAALHGHYRSTDEARTAERLLLPVSDEDGAPRFVFGITLYRLGGDTVGNDTAPNTDLQFYRLSGLSGLDEAAAP